MKIEFTTLSEITRFVMFTIKNELIHLVIITPDDKVVVLIPVKKYWS